MTAVSKGIFVLTLAVIAVASTTAAAQDSNTHRFWDTKNTTAFTVTAAIRAADAGYTCAQMDNPNFRERWLPVKSCAGVSGWLAATQGSQLAITYWAHRTGHHRLERWVPYVWTGPSAVGIGYTIVKSKP